MGALRVSLLGSFRASVGDAALPAGGVKQRAVLAMLALDRRGDSSRRFHCCQPQP
jgi:DNA-binding SARP family transcriptional activator